MDKKQKNWETTIEKPNVLNVCGEVYYCEGWSFGHDILMIKNFTVCWSGSSEKALRRWIFDRAHKVENFREIHRPMNFYKQELLNDALELYEVLKKEFTEFMGNQSEKNLRKKFLKETDILREFDRFDK